MPVMAQDDNQYLPDWLSLSFQQQSRMQVLDGQFRAGLDGDDQAFEWRNTLTATASFFPSKQNSPICAPFLMTVIPRLIL